MNDNNLWNFSCWRGMRLVEKVIQGDQFLLDVVVENLNALEMTISKATPSMKRKKIRKIPDIDKSIFEKKRIWRFRRTDSRYWKDIKGDRALISAVKKKIKDIGNNRIIFYCIIDLVGENNES